MTHNLMISISGVRGVVGESLSPELLVRMGEAFGTWLRGRRGRPGSPGNGPAHVVVGRDSRTSGEMVKHAVCAGLLSSGAALLDVGVVPTPTVTLMIEHLKADGGVMISASHNPIEWNALKFFRSDGIYLNEREGKDLLDIYYSGKFASVRWDGFHDVERYEKAEDLHIGRILEYVDADIIRKRRLRVAIDACNGAGGGAAIRLLEQLGCSVAPIHCTPNGLFPHYPEPVFVNLGDLCSAVRSGGSDIGFALDPDADRVAIVDGNGHFIGEELTLALAVRYRLERGARGPVVVNMSTSRVTEDVARAASQPFVRTAVGEVNVAERMKLLKSPIGGEGNGGVIDPRIHYGRDALAGIAILLEAMARSGQSVHELAQSLPRYCMVKEKVDCPRTEAQRVLEELRAEAADAGAQVNTEDGVRLDWPDRWVHLRASNTEPILRVIAEAASEADVDALVKDYRSRVFARL